MNLKEAYDQGYRDALTLLAFYSSGEQVVGITRIPLKKAHEDLTQFYNYLPPSDTRQDSLTTEEPTEVW